MAEKVIPEGLLALLLTVDTRTVCNAIEVAQTRRGARHVGELGA